MTNKIVPSPQTQQEAMKVAKATQKPGQTKEQTKLIAQGIEKGIALYKKQQKEKHRQADRARKKALRTKQPAIHEDIDSEIGYEDEVTPSKTLQWLPWGLLIASWVGFILFWMQNSAQ
ncbi:DUF2956 domain-containing protein [Vibrio fluvialis]|uniref:DUF2956 domain-containing protein n=1 Tax=Vibrio fluvialis TaxID=676 RepID=UPI000646D068|nr:DUF2956 domain-containing protein [Vibrio fluvialis]EKO3496706.1 DUF2956 domain-containing protein [Vibrio fluvialis]MBY7769941.1 DUF2956 domain-containing protein [Vibrio fluvialis]MBY8033593.1 DUF2956 domain-containing protein [Vibrio fluvialis]MBY8192860.1 DUF2956 domain-containing protein [Vibrio fluvialis]MBY8213366.1 DUF2956 domain-containing protein [Vibrio fluvialis]